MKCTANDFSISLNKILDDYKIEVDKRTDKAVAKAAKLVKAQLVTASPVGAGDNGHLKDKWQIKKGEGRRIITNTKRVKGKGSAKIPLVNILEYSTVHGHPFVNSALQGVESEVKAIFENAMR